MQVHTRLFYNKLKCQILELFKTEYYIDEMSVQKYPSLIVVMSDSIEWTVGENKYLRCFNKHSRCLKMILFKVLMVTTLSSVKLLI